MWFGEAVPMMEKAIQICLSADILLIIGTSMQVYPAASLMHYVNADVPICYIDPKPTISSSKQITVIAEPATVGVSKFVELLS